MISDFLIQYFSKCNSPILRGAFVWPREQLQRASFYSPKPLPGEDAQSGQARSYMFFFRSCKPRYSSQWWSLLQVTRFRCMRNNHQRSLTPQPCHCKGGEIWMVKLGSAQFLQFLQPCPAQELWAAQKFDWHHYLADSEWTWPMSDSPMMSLEWQFTSRNNKKEAFIPLSHSSFIIWAVAKANLTEMTKAGIPGHPPCSFAAC